MGDLIVIPMRKFTIPLEFPSAEELKQVLDAHRQLILTYYYPNGIVIGVAEDEEGSEDAVEAVRNYLESNEWLYEEIQCDLFKDRDMLIAFRQLQEQYYGERNEKDNS